MKNSNVMTNNIIRLVNRITATKDTAFQEDETRYMASSLMSDLTENFRERSKFVAAILQHLVDCGFDIVSGVKCEAQEKFIATFGYRITRMKPDQLARVREITTKLFSQA